MAWTSKQKQLAVRACRAAAISEDVRTDMILRNFAHAHYDGDITSTSPKLTNQDFAAFMAIVERHAGGKILHFTAGYWDERQQPMSCNGCGTGRCESRPSLRHRATSPPTASGLPAGFQNEFPAVRRIGLNAWSFPRCRRSSLDLRHISGNAA